MKARKFILCMLATMSFMVGATSITAYAEETINTVPVETTSNTNESNTYDIDEAEVTSNEAIIQENVEASRKDDVVESVIEKDDIANDSVEEKDNAQKESEEVVELEEGAGKDSAETEESKEKDEVKKTETKKEETNKEETKKKETKKEEAKYTKSDLRLLSALIYAEAGNQSYKGKLAVANVVINRTDSKRFSHVDTIKEAIYDKKWGVQFSVIKKGSDGISPLDEALDLYDSLEKANGTKRELMEQCIKAAKDAFNGKNNIGGYLFFTRYNKSIARKFSDHTVIQAHIFY